MALGLRLSTGRGKAPPKNGSGPTPQSKKAQLFFFSPGNYRVELWDSQRDLAPAGLPQDLRAQVQDWAAEG